jgi:predicted nucleic acid-binding protein
LTTIQTEAGAVATGWVIDTSVTMPWFFPDEATPFTEGLLDALGDQPLWVPALWVLECSNFLQNAQRQARIEPDRRLEIIGELAELPVRMDDEPLEFVRLDRLAAAHGLSAYGAAYLDLALRRELTLVSLDAKLIAAAKTLGHPVMTATAQAADRFSR